MRLDLAPKIAGVRDDMVVVEEEEDKGEDGVSNKPTRRCSLKSINVVIVS